jgi:hypothetical protein
VLALLIAHKQTNIAHPHKQHKKIHPQPQQEPNKFIKATQTKNKKSPLEISSCRNLQQIKKKKLNHNLLIFWDGCLYTETSTKHTKNRWLNLISPPTSTIEPDELYADT